MARRRTQTEPERDETERVGEPIRSAMSGGTDIWIDSQMKLFEQIEEVARHWLDRRREALDATRRTMEEMRGCEHVGDLMRLQQEWIFGALQRLTADVAELGGAAFTLPRVGAARLGQAGDGMVHEIGRAGSEALSAAGSKPGMEDGE